MRNMSFFNTLGQFLAGMKTVTFRLGWDDLYPGDRIMAIAKGQGIKKGEKVQRLGEIEIIAVRLIQVYEISDADIILDGFGGMPKSEWIKWFCRQMGCHEGRWVSRIEFRRINSER